MQQVMSKRPKVRGPGGASRPRQAEDGGESRSSGLGSAGSGFGEDGAHESIEACAVRCDRADRLGLLPGESGGDLGKATLDTLVHDHRAADQGTDACVDFGIEGSGITAGNLDTGQLAGTTRGQMLTP